MSKSNRTDEVPEFANWRDEARWESFLFPHYEPTEEEIKYTYYKWEFLRRNEEYESEWKQLIADVKSKYGELEANAVARQLPRECTYKMFGEFGYKFLPEETAFCKRWNIAMALRPDMSYEDYIATEHQFLMIFGYSSEYIDLAGRYYMFRSLNLRTCQSVRALIESKEGVAQYRENGILIVEVNINYPKKQLKKEFSTLVDHYKNWQDANIFLEMMIKYCKERNVDPALDPNELDKDEWGEFRELYSQELKKRRAKYGQKTTLHWDNFDTYLKVWDLKREDKSYSEIADLLELNSMDTAINHYKTAKRLIEEGIDLYGK
jgi:hypothetical protein